MNAALARASRGTNAKYPCFFSSFFRGIERNWDMFACFLIKSEENFALEYAILE